MRLTITSKGTTVENAWGLANNVVWSGDKQRAARTLAFDLAAGQDTGLPAVECPVGAQVSFFDDDEALLFYGTVVRRGLDSEGTAMSVTAMDRGLYLANNDGTYKIKNETPESAVGRLCADYGIPVGSLAGTGVRVSRKFAGVSLWQIVVTLYTLAAQTTGKRYMARFEGPKLVVEERLEQARSLVIRPKSNLLTASTTESIEAMRNSVGIYDKDGRRLQTVRDQSAVGLYGLMERHITAQDGEDSGAKAKEILADNGLERSVSVTCIGDTGLITGRTVAAVQPAAGLSGIFWIDSDKHSWTQRAGYTCQLSLNLRNVAYEAQAGGEVK